MATVVSFYGPPKNLKYCITCEHGSCPDVVIPHRCGIGASLKGSGMSSRLPNTKWAEHRIVAVKAFIFAFN